MEAIRHQSNVLLLWALTTIALTVILTSCKKPDPSETPEEFNRGALLTHLADELIIPSYAEFQVAVNELQNSANELANNPTSGSLSEARNSWRTTVLSWQKVAMFEFGPAADITMQASTNVYPVDTVLVESNLSSGSYNLASIANLAARGFPALDYLLFGGASEESIIDLYTTDPNASGRVDYLLAVAAELKTNTDQIVNAWQSTGGNYRNTFIANIGTDAGSSLGLFLNAFTKSFEQNTRKEKLGLPSGASTFSQTPLPDLVEAYYEFNNNITYIAASVQAFENVYSGTNDLGEDGVGLDDYLDFLGATYFDDELNATILDQLATLKTAVSTLNDPLSDYVVSNQTEAIQVYAEMQQLVVLWKVDMMSSLGVLVTYQDNDGD